ncbi:hypothetical protein D3C78_1290710 [compost metagenome]
MRDVFAHAAVAARRGLHQHSVFVTQAHGQAVELGLGHVFHGRVAFVQAQLAADAAVEGLGAAGFGIGFGAYAEHGHDMLHGRKSGHDGADHPLRGRVGRDQLGMAGFERLQLLIEPVVLGVGHGGRVQHIVLVGPDAQLRAQGRYVHGSGCRILGGIVRLPK